MSASESRYEPRHEAEVVAWNDLTEDQRAAVEGAHGLFSQMAKVADEAKKRESSGLAELDIFLPHIDEQRRNHVVLIDGERGTGKTAVMLRLLVDWSAAVRGKLREDVGTKELGMSPVDKDSAIVPVGLLDLQALSPKAMLGLHLAGHLQRVVEAMEGRPSKSTKTAPWAPGESEELKSRKAWRKFLSAAAAAWDGNLKERQGKIDPEAYIIELEHAERERLEIGGTFRAFVNALVDDYHQQFHPKNKPFFVITIDDADMNPQRTMEIFELIRVLWHPRVGFLIAGDGDLFVTVLEEDFKKHEIATAQAEALARDSYRKAIPPTQRRRIGMKPHERYRKLEPTLQQIASSADVLGSRPTAMNYFQIDRDLQEAFPRRIRYLIDTQNQLAADLASKSLSIGRLAHFLWHSALESADGVRELEERNLVLHDAQTGRIDIVGPIQFVAERREIDRKQLNPTSRAILYDLRAFTRHEKHYRIPERVLPALQLAVNVSVHEHGRPAANGSPIHIEPPLAILDIEFVEGTQTLLATGWQVPQWESFLEYKIFFSNWGMHAGRWVVERGIDGLAIRFVEIVLNHIERNWRRDGDRIEILLSEHPPTWKDLAERIVRLMNIKSPSTHREKIAKEWVENQATLLAAPEYGLSSTAANAWLEALQGVLGEHWDTTRKTLHARRAAKVGQAGAKIDTISQEYLWISEINATDNIHNVDNIVRHLAKIPVKNPNGILWPRNLAEYITNSRYQALLKTHNGALSNVWNAVQRAPRDVAGAEEITMYNIWDAAVPPEMRVRDYVQWDRDRSGLKVAIPSDSWVLRAGGSTLTGSVVNFLEVSFEWAYNAQNTISYTGAFLRLAQDVAADKIDTYTEGTSTISKWPGATGTSSIGHVWKWPIPNWTALIDWELMIESWATTLKSAAGLRRDNDHRQAQRIADALGFWFICRVAQMSMLRNAAVDFRFELASNDWQNLGINLPHTGGVTISARDMVYAQPSESKERTGARWDAYKAWWDAVVIMAAPESGLSPEAAEAFLNGLYATHDIKNRPKREKADARRYRRGHAIRCGTPENQVDRLLARIDAANPDHPWHKFFAPETT